ncbi:MAG: hypothetical protein VKL39_23740, partial [Leptolyngbyaceae bacterium]|nr:hypothetical protein [Leptolyngbyaceae bacterium]
IPYRNSSGYLTRLAKGAEGTLLRAGASVPAYSTFTIPNTISALSAFVANSANVLTEITPSAGQSIRVNAGGTAWEAYTPGGGGIGGSTGSVDNALLRADGTGGSTVQSSAVLLSDTADLTLGLAASTTGTNRIIDVAGTETHIGVAIQAKGVAGVFLGSGGSQFTQVNGILYAVGGIVLGSGGSTYTINGRDQSTLDSDSDDIIFRSGNAGTGGTGDHNSGDLYFDIGTKAGSGVRGNTGFNTTSVANWQSMERGLFFGNATTTPTGNPADGVFEYSTDVEGTAEKYIRTESGAVVCVSGLLEPIEVSGTTLTLSEDHRGKFLYFTNAAGCTVTVPTTLKKGFSCVMMQDHVSGTISTTGATVNGKTATTAQYDTIGLVHYKDTDIYFGK